MTGNMPISICHYIGNQKMSKFSMIEKKPTDFAFDLLRLEARWEDQSWDKVRDHIRRMRRKAVMRQQDG